MTKTKQHKEPREYPPDTRPTKPITIDGVTHQIHIKPVLGEAGEYDLYDVNEVFNLIATGTPWYECAFRDPCAWRWYRMTYQRGTGMYRKYKMAPFVFYGAPSVPHDGTYFSLISPSTRQYCIEAGVYDYLGYFQNGEWENVVKHYYHANDLSDPSITHPIIDDTNQMEDGWVIGQIHSPTMDRQREQGATEEEIYEQCLRNIYGAEEIPPGVVLGG